MKKMILTIAIFTINLYGMKEEEIVLNDNETPLLNIQSKPSDYSQFNAKTFSYEKTLKDQGHSAFTDIAFHPHDPHIIISGSLNNCVKIWDIRKNKCIRLQSKPKKKLLQLGGCFAYNYTVGAKTQKIAINPKGTLLASAGVDREIIVSAVEHLNIIKNIRLSSVSHIQLNQNKYAVHDDAQDVKKIIFHPLDNNILIAGLYGDNSTYGSTINNIVFLNTDNKTQNVLQEHFNDLGDFALSPCDSNNLVVASYKKISRFDLATMKITNAIKIIADRIAFNPKMENQFVTSGWDSTDILVWDTKEYRPTKRLPLKGFVDNKLKSIAIDPTGKEIIVTSQDLTQIFDLSSGKRIQKLNNRPFFSCFSSNDTSYHYDNIKNVIISHDGKNIATQSSDTIKIWNK